MRLQSLVFKMWAMGSIIFTAIIQRDLAVRIRLLTTLCRRKLARYVIKIVLELSRKIELDFEKEKKRESQLTI